MKLVVEVDGGIHKTKTQKEWNEDRTFKIQLMDTEVIRFTNEEVLNETGRVLKEFSRKCNELKMKQSKK